MKSKVADVMTFDVVAVHGQTPFKEIVGLLRHHGVSAAPVIDDDGRVLGVVSMMDLLLKEADPTADEEPHPLAGPARRREIRKAIGTVAADLMTSPAITISPAASVEQAAAEMRRHHIGRLPVIEDDSGRLVGIVSRGDVVDVFRRPDERILGDIVHELIPGELAMDPLRFAVTVENGKVTIRGTIERRSEIPRLLHAVRRVEGVVSAEADLGYDVDDTFARVYPQPTGRPGAR